jgi:hypothetical protein
MATDNTVSNLTSGGTPVLNSSSGTTTSNNFVINPSLISDWKYSSPVTQPSTRIGGSGVIRLKKNLGNGYWAVLKVYEDSELVYCSLNHGHRWKRLLWHLPYWDFTFFESFGDTLESKLGNAYLKMDKMIEADKGSKGHSKFVKDMVKTDPENLKMIAGLDKLDKATNPARLKSAYSSNVTVAGTEMFYSGNGS